MSHHREPSSNRPDKSASSRAHQHPHADPRSMISLVDAAKGLDVKKASSLRPHVVPGSTTVPLRRAPVSNDGRQAALSIQDMTVAYHHKPVLWDIDVDLPEGMLIGIVGPNGAGKTTLIRACLDLVPKASGQVRFYGRPYARLRKHVGYVPQRETVDWQFPVSALDVVTMGQYAKIGWCRPVTRKHKDAAMRALDRVGMTDLRPPTDQPAIRGAAAACVPRAGPGPGREALLHG